MIIFRKSLIIIVGIALLAAASMVFADSTNPARNFGTPSSGAMQYGARADSDIQVTNPPTGSHPDCQASFHNICWAQKLPPQANAKY